MNVFLDTNVFLYAFLNQDVAKKVVAASLVAQSVKERTGHVSMQVVKEFCNVMVKKSGKSSAEIGKAVALFGLFNIPTRFDTSPGKSIPFPHRHGK